MGADHSVHTYWSAECRPCGLRYILNTQDAAIAWVEEHVNALHAAEDGASRAARYAGHVTAASLAEFHPATPGDTPKEGVGLSSIAHGDPDPAPAPPMQLVEE